LPLRIRLLLADERMDQPGDVAVAPEHEIQVRGQRRFLGPGEVNFRRPADLAELQGYRGQDVSDGSAVRDANHFLTILLDDAHERILLEIAGIAQFRLDENDR